MPAVIGPNPKTWNKRIQKQIRILKEAIRKRFDEPNIAQSTPKLVPPLEHFNVNEEGVRILDRTLASKTTNGRIIDIYFKPDNVWCDYCQSSNCQHTKFALELQAVQEILNKKGWTIKG